MQQQVQIPQDYYGFLYVFSKAKATGLPPHWDYHCAIDLLADTESSKGHIYPLSQLEHKAIEEYIKEALAQKYIMLSTSPASACFFVEKNEEVLGHTLITEDLTM